MGTYELLVIMVVVALLVAVIATRTSFPQPIAMLIAGLVIAAVPGIPRIYLEPDLIFYILLPPILFEAAYFTSWRDFVHYRRAIFLLAVGLVTVTSAVVAAICVALIPGMSWANGFLLGAIVSPPDAAAATAITRKLHLPPRIVHILEGESLVNDASALTLYRFALAAAVSGSFSLSSALGAFFWTALGGTTIGLVLGYTFVKVYPRLVDEHVEILSTFLLSFSSYLIAERAHTSGVLSVVAAGLVLGWHSPRLFTATTRIRATAVWQSLLFVIQAVMFLGIGLVLPEVLAALRVHSPAELLFWGSILSAAVILVRFAWVFPGTYLPRWLSADIRRREPEPDWRAVFVVGYTGLRGVVSLAAAQALPATVNGHPFVHRDLMLFLTFFIILVTLGGQGVLLSKVIALVKLPCDQTVNREHLEARIYAAEQALVRLAEIESDAIRHPEVLGRIRGYFTDRLTALRAEMDASNLTQRPAAPEQFSSLAEQKLWWELAHVERNAVLQMRRERRIGDEAMRRIEHDLDLLEARIVPQS